MRSESKVKRRIIWACGILTALFLAFAATGVQAEATKLPALRVEGTRLVNSKGRTVQLKGVSTHGLSWFPQYVNQSAFTYMKKNWGINTVRLAMYTAEYNGYCTGDEANRRQLLKLIDDGVASATKAGLYVIIDWHILSDGNPQTYQKQAVDFFKKAARKYKDHTNVLYEICNEPNGGTSWSTIKSYARKVIRTIRKYDKDGVIIVGTPNWSQDVDVAAQSPIRITKNIMYSLHFYAGTHKDWLRQKAQSAVSQGLPLFVTEFAICDASGNGNMDKTEGARWIRFLNQNKISYVAWNLSNKAETSSLISASSQKVTGWKNKELSPWARWLIKKFKGK